ncbi:hypothetical protein [Celerinatantimonas yamalensis]|uniref:Uncharacterized protein n=1 Tax=Celerinatantimonas yamalensis TaxID=559956 RepID=A0ABW9G2Z0_9GAMM
MLIHEQLQFWVDQLLATKYRASALSCECFYPALKGYFPREYLAQCSYIVVDELPSPEHFFAKHQIDMPSFVLNSPRRSVTYGKQYFIHNDYVEDVAVHLHELVHTCQWHVLGSWFLGEFIQQIQEYSIDNAPLEIMACEVEHHFRQHGSPIDVKSLVYSRL